MIDDLRTHRRDDGVRPDMVAAGLACGAQLTEAWDVRGAADWQRAMDTLLAERGRQPIDVAMDLRWQATVVRTVPPDLAGWQRIIRQAAEYGQVGPAQVPMLLVAAARISHHEDRFRTDGLIAPHGVVHSVRGYDWGRAAGLASWGRRAGLCGHATADRALSRVARLCGRHYMSWADLSVAFALGLLLSFDDKDLPERYTEVLATRRKLLSEEGSPWRTIPWPPPDSPN